MNEQDKKAFDIWVNSIEFSHGDDDCEEAAELGWQAALEYARQQEPVAVVKRCVVDDEFIDGANNEINVNLPPGTKLYASPVATDQEPRYWVHNFGDEDGGEEFFDHPTGSDCPECIPLYLAPQPAPYLLNVLKHIEGAAMDIECERTAIRDAARAAIAKYEGSK